MGTTGGKWLTHDFDRLLWDLMEEYKIPDACVAIIDREKTEWTGLGSGTNSGDGNDEDEDDLVPKAWDDTVFDCASMSKSFTAAAIALLVDDNDNYPDFNWDTPVSEIMGDDFVLHDKYTTEHVTVVDMLCHRTGIPGYWFATLGRNSRDSDTPKSVTRKLRHFPPTRPFRTAAQYNNEMFTAASYLVEKVTGQKFPDFLQEKFFNPLEMTQTGFIVANLLKEGWNFAQPQFYNEKTLKYENIPGIEGPEGQGAGEIKSTVRDWLKWIQAMMSNTTGISNDSVRELLKPRLLADVQPDDDGPHQSPRFVGLGWEIEYYRGQTIVSHGGSDPGISSYMAFLPGLKFGFVMYGTSDGMNDAADIISHRLIDDKLGVPDADRADWVTSVRESVKKQKEDDDQAKSELYKYETSSPIPHSLPLVDYTGSYEQPGYGQLKLEVKADKLCMDCRDRTFAILIWLDHVTEERFVARIESVPDTGESICTKAAFKINDSGQVVQLGIAFADAEEASLLWFDKV